MPRAPWMPILLLAAGSALQGSPPVLGGVRLGATAGAVRAALGRPDRTEQSLGMQFWDYDRRSITVIWREGDLGVLGIIATASAAGPVGGVKVGDSEARLRRQWGAPARERQDGRFLDFVGARWVLSAEMRAGVVRQLTLMRTRDGAR